LLYWVFQANGTMNSQFRSNLMRQIVATARHQARPPAALLGWINELDSNNTNDSADAAGSSAAADSSFLSYGRGTASTSAAASAAAGVVLRRRISPGGREYNECLPPILPSSTRSEVANSSLVAAQQQNPAMASSALGTATPTAPDGSSSLFALPAAAASESGAGSARSTRWAQAAAPTTADRGGGPVEEEEEDGGEDAASGGGPRAEEEHHLEDGSISSPTYEQLPQLFQNLILTRRTRSHFAPLQVDEEEGGGGSAAGSSRAYWTRALDRAVLCGYAAPNHRRTEPFTFRRIVAPSAKTRDLADVAYHVQLHKLQLQRRRKLQQQQESQVSTFHQHDNSNPSGSAALEEAEDAQSAQRKRDKWSQIPAFLVATVKAPSLLEIGGDVARKCDGTAGLDVDGGGLASRFLYEPAQYTPPSTIRELEDYASCCAAVQNVLLSLHSEGIGSKWATGDVIQTPAFRHLMEIHEDERVVALVQVGHPANPRAAVSSSTRSEGQSQLLLQPLRRHRRPLKGDVLVDL
jgi:nitroreductase